METAKDFITDQKMPNCGCAICLCDFEEKENGNWNLVIGLDYKKKQGRIHGKTSLLLAKPVARYWAGAVIQILRLFGLNIAKKLIDK